MPSRSPLSRRLQLSAVAFAVPLLLLALVELALRLATGAPEPWIASYWDRLLVQTVPCDAALQADEKSRGAFRLAVVGESSGEFLGDELKLLSEHFPAVEVLSCGMSASSLEQIAIRFEEVRRAKPDAVLVVLGHNLEKNYPTDRRHIRLQWWLAHSRLLTLLAGRFDRSLGGRPPGNVPIEERLPVLERFYRRAAEEAKTDGFRLVLSTVTPNFWLPAFVNPGDTREEDPGPAVYEARWLHATGRLAEAVALLSTKAAEQTSPSLPFELAMWRDEAGDREGAREAFERALSCGTNRVVQPTNDLTRRLAQETGAGLRDMLADSERAASDGIPGWESVEDNCHLFRALFARQGVQLVQELAPPVIAGPFAAAVVPELQPVERFRVIGHHVQALHRAERAGDGDHGTSGLDYVRRSLASATFRLLHELGPDAPQKLDEALAQALAEEQPGAVGKAAVLSGVAEGEWNAGLRTRARAHLAESRHLQETAHAARLEGLWNAAEGRLPEAAGAFEAGLALAPADAELRYFLAKAKGG